MANHTKPRTPEKTNDQRQPNANAIQGIASAAKAPPTLEPLSKIATATLRSWLGNHSATVLLAAGQLKPSPMPKRKRKDAKLKTEPANPVRILTTDQKMTATAKPTRVPTASRKMPPRSHVTAYEIWKAPRILARS